MLSIAKHETRGQEPDRHYHPAASEAVGEHPDGALQHDAPDYGAGHEDRDPVHAHTDPRTVYRAQAQQRRHPDTLAEGGDQS